MQSDRKPIEKEPVKKAPVKKKPASKRLGRGLELLMGEDHFEEGAVADAKSVRHLPIEHLRRNPDNPRKTFAEDDLDELASSIGEKGLIQPILVRPLRGEDGRYEIVAGERRWRAAQRADIHDVPVLVRELDDDEALELALVENVQRTDLNPLEEAHGYRRLMDRFGYTQEKTAKTLGKSRSHVANTLRLLKLPEGVREHLREGRLSAGHARALIEADDPEALARRIVDSGLSVRDAEKIARDASGGSGSRKPGPPAKSPDTIALEEELRSHLGLKVEISAKGERGRLKIDYTSLEQLDDLCARLSKAPRGPA